MSKKIKLSSLIQDDKNNNKHTAYGMDLLEKSVNNTTVENMTKLIYDYFKPKHPLLIAIEMSETPKTNCRYEP